MNIQEQVCTSAQALRLRELNVMQLSYMCYVSEIPGALDSFELVPADGYSWTDYPCYSCYPTIIPAYTVAELGVMLPDTYKKAFQGDVMAQITSCRHFESGDYYCWVERLIEQEQIFSISGHTEAEARAAMLIYLLENNLTTAEEVNNRLNPKTPTP